MAILYNYGTLEPIPFKLTKNGAGVTGQAPFTTGDILYIDDTDSTADIALFVTEISNGWYKFTPPTASFTQTTYFIINVKEVSGTNFDENGILCLTGGDAAARFSG